MSIVKETRAFEIVGYLIDEGKLIKGVISLVAHVEWDIREGKDKKEFIEAFRITKLKMGHKTLQVSNKMHDEICQLLKAPERG